MQTHTNAAPFQEKYPKHSEAFFLEAVAPTSLRPLLEEIKEGANRSESAI
jgi:hypothetical protein